MFIIERLKDFLHNPTLITQNPLSSLHKQSQKLERALNSSTKSLSNQGISPRELRVRLSFGSSLGYHVVYHLGDHMPLLGVSERKHNSEHGHKKK